MSAADNQKPESTPTDEQRLSRSIAGLGATALKAAAAHDELRERVSRCTDIIDLAKNNLAKGDTKACMRVLLRARLELAS
jgi:hypothetical protein